ncbi:hypothetical protein TNCV_1458901 [Trichonephila clavipes]|nr:hypothetical protein TNCV_1458901 [Trichonephila clavipes]
MASKLYRWTFKGNRNPRRFSVKALQEVLEISVIDMYASTKPKRHGLVDMFENSGCFTDRCSSVKYSCLQVHFRFTEASSIMTLKEACSSRFLCT